MAHSKNTDGLGGLVRPQGAPRGLLAYYILHRIAERPVHGYEILQDIGNRTGGAWRPGAGSIYPILKKFCSDGYIKYDRTRRGLPTAQKVYQITEEGERHLTEFNEKFAEVGRNWGAMRRIILELIQPDQLDRFLVDGTRSQFEMWQEAFESKLDKLRPGESEYILKEYAITLERQLRWANEKLGGIKKQVTVSG